MVRRIFFAVSLPDTAKRELLSLQKQWPELPARWTASENLHLTLVFLGNASDGELEEVKRVAREVASRHQPFSVRLSRVQYGPDEKRPRMVWAVGEAPKKLQELQADLARSLAKDQGIAFQLEERPFTWHLTLARLKELEFRQLEPEERPEVTEQLNMELPVEALDIMESKLKRSGAEYELLERIPLAG